MRLLICVCIIALHVVNFTASQDAIVFRDQDISFPASFNRFRPAQLNAMDYITRHSLSGFSGRFLKEVAHNTEGKFVCSPYSVSVLLTLMLQGAKGYTGQLIRETLELPDENYVTNTGFYELTRSLTTYNKVNLHVANGIFIFSNKTLQDHFYKIVTDDYASHVQKISSKNPIEASRIINGWCANHTQDTIQNLVTPGDFDANTKLIIVNAMYFKGPWLTKFNRANTRILPFHINEHREIQIETMNSFSTYYHGAYPEVDATFVELPYDSQDSNHNVSMFVILPKNKVNGIQYLEENMEKITLSKLINRGTKKEVDVYLPKFNITREISLQQPLAAMGMSHIFGKYVDFSDIIRDSELEISHIVQKAFIKVDEAGSIASAATDVVFSTRKLGEAPPVLFLANHPFYVIIATRGKNAVNLFTARYTGE